MSSPLPDASLPPLPLELTADRDITRLIVGDVDSASSAHYTAAATEVLTVEAVSVTFATPSVTGTTTVTVTVTDAAGNVVAIFQTDASTWSAQTSQVTFGGGLPDSRQYANAYSDTNAQSGMPPVALEGGSTLRVDLGGPDGVMQELRLWVEDLALQDGRSAPLPPRLAHRPLTGR